MAQPNKDSKVKVPFHLALPDFRKCGGFFGGRGEGEADRLWTKAQRVDEEEDGALVN